jgi:hypothetical protein
VAGGGEAGEKAERVAIDARVALRANGSAFGVRDARIHGKSCGLAFPGQLDRPLGRQVPGVIKIQVRDLARQRFGFDEPRVGILGRVARDRAGFFHRLAHRGASQVRRARGSFALAEINGHPEAPVALVLDGVHLAEAHAHRQALGHRGVGLGRRGAMTARLREGEACDVFKLPAGGRCDGRLHQVKL